MADPCPSPAQQPSFTNRSQDKCSLSSGDSLLFLGSALVPESPEAMYFLTIPFLYPLLFLFCEIKPSLLQLTSLVLQFNFPPLLHSEP